MSKKRTDAEKPMESAEHPNFASSLIDCLSLGVLALGANRQILAWNEAAEKLTGLHAREVLGRSISCLPPALQAVLDETLVTGRPAVRRQILLGRADGSNELLQVTTSIAHLPGGNALSVTAEIQSVGQAQGMAANLERLDRLANVGVLSASVAHEIKNALVAIRTFVDLTSEKSEDPALATVVSHEIKRIDAVVRQILRGANREEFRFAPIQLHALITETGNLLRNLLKARGVNLALNLAAPSDRIKGDEHQLRHALVNLLINALEAISKTGTITLATEVTEAWSRPQLRMSITDTGCGIQPDHLPRLFSPFFTTKSEGTGLGLAITRRIIQEHQGAITVESKPGQGTTFQVFFPLLQ